MVFYLKLSDLSHEGLRYLSEVNLGLAPILCIVIDAASSVSND